MIDDATDHQELGMIWALTKIHWQFFVTIPLPRRRGIANSCVAIWNGFRGRLRKELKASDGPPLLWVVTLEWGKSGENPHLHALIGGLPRDIQPMVVMRVMENIGVKMGVSKVVSSVIDGRPNAVSYLFKEAIKSDIRRGTPDGRWPMISDSVWKALLRHPDMR